MNQISVEELTRFEITSVMASSSKVFQEFKKLEVTFTFDQNGVSQTMYKVTIKGRLIHTSDINHAVTIYNRNYIE